MNALICCIKKDVIEYMRGKKNILCVVVLSIICFMVLGITLVFPALIDQIMLKTPELISDPSSIKEIMIKLFPHNLRGSVGIVASDIGVFYTLFLTFSCHNLLTKELKSGNWLLPVSKGYKNGDFIISKCIVYGVGMSFPIFVIYNLYFCVAALWLEIDVKFETILFNSLILVIAFSVIIIIILLSSVLYKQSMMAALSVLIFIITAPDILTFFSFGKYFPTYLLSFVYSVSDSCMDVLIPLVECIIIILEMYLLAERKTRYFELERG